MNKIVFSLIIFLVFFLNSCQERSFFQNKISIVENNWNYEDTLNFKVDISDTSQLYELYISVENTEEYSNSNLWLFVTTISPENYVLKDTLELFLSDYSGKWFGKKSSNKYNSYHYFKRQVIFPKKGTYSFDINQGMRDLNLLGISNIGIIIKESGKE